MSFDFDTNRIKYLTDDFNDFMNSYLRFLSIYSQTSQSWSSFMSYNDFHMRIFPNKNVISWFQNSCFSKHISDWFMISYISSMKHNSWFIQLIWELAFWSQDNLSIIVYLHSSSMSKIIVHFFLYIITLIFVSIQIDFCQLCVLSVWTI